MRSSQVQVVTGLVVNRKPNIARTYVETLRRDILHAAESGMLSECQRLSIEGRAKYVGMVNRGQGTKVHALMERFLPAVLGNVRDKRRYEYRVCRSGKRHRVKRGAPKGVHSLLCREGWVGT